MKLSDKRKSYYIKIWVYKKRREDYRQQGKKEQVYKTSRKIAQWKYQIGRIDKRNSIINDLILTVNEYFELDIRLRVYNKKYNLARNIFYKYGMEHRLEGTVLARSLGRTRGKTAGECRLRLTKSFRSNPEIKEIYHRFRLFMEINAQKAA